MIRAYRESMVMAARTADDIGQVLRSWAAVEEPLMGDVPAVLVAHGVICADLLAQWHGEDLELQVAGLLHDIGLLLVPGDELGHPANGASYARDLLGARTARLISLHVDAQRYLELTKPGYKVTPPPTAEFAPQPDPMTAGEARAFELDPLHQDVLELRRADDAASDTSARADGVALERQLDRVRRLAARIGSSQVS